MIRKVLLGCTVAIWAVSGNVLVSRGDDPSRVSSRRTRHWTAPSSSIRQERSESSQGLSSRLRAIRDGSAGVPAVPPATGTGQGMPSVLRRPAASTPISAEPRGLGRSVRGSEQPIRLGRRGESGLGEVASSGRSVRAVDHLPGIEVEMVAPEAVILGRPGEWLVRVRNTGDRPAPVLRVLASLPASATLSSTRASQGQVAQRAATDRVLQWQIDHLAARSEATLAIALVATRGEPMDLQLQWEVVPTAMTARVEVREPKLDVAISGPTEMKYGTTAEFTLTLYNPGTGPAEDVTIAVASGASRTQPQQIGTLPAGGQRTIPIDLTADQAGELEVVVTASAAGGLKAVSRHRVRVRRPRLEIAIRGPQRQYAGVPVTYTVEVANRGDIESDQTVLEVELPEGAEVSAASAGARQVDGRVTWQLGELASGAQRVLQLRTILHQAGANRLHAEVRGSGSPPALAQVETRVELIADLKLTVLDPAGPQPVGEEIPYRVIIENRGSKTARNVHVIAFFSEGIEPAAAKGSEYQKKEGQVIFAPIDAIAPGAKVELVVVAVADRPGSHRFRAEVECKDIETRLAAEETTKCYQ